jgi:hypothetical protein
MHKKTHRFSFPFPYKNVYSPTGLVPPSSHLTSCTPTKCNLYFDSFLKLSLHSIILISYPYSTAWVIYPKNPSRSEALFVFRNKFNFYSGELLAPLPTTKLEDHPLFARSCLFNIFIATLHSWRLFLHLQPEYAPCCGDRDPSNVAS